MSYERTEEGSYSLIYPKKTCLRARLHLHPHTACPHTLPSEGSLDLTQAQEEGLFLDFVSQLLCLDPCLRPTAEEALAHPWLRGADSLPITLPPHTEEVEGHQQEEEEEEEDEGAITPRH
jgi:serine/threonine protein kinase